MFFFFSKLLQPLLWPFNLALLALTAATVCLTLRRDRLARGLVLFSLLVLLVPSFPFFSFFLFRQLEWTYPVLSSEQAPVADAIVVLGGSISNSQPPHQEPEELNGSRLVPAVRLFRYGKAPWILVSSGTSYLLPTGAFRTEADDMRDFLASLGVPLSAVLLEKRSRNTDENARFTVSILKERALNKILLVTSAFHLPRAVAMFNKYGVQDIVPFPTENRITLGPPRWLDFVPDLAALGMTTAFIKETVGRWVYQR